MGVGGGGRKHMKENGKTKQDRERMGGKPPGKEWREGRKIGNRRNAVLRGFQPG